MISSEVAPFSKTGGLGEVCGELSAALARAGHRVVTVSPRYRGERFAKAVDTGFRLSIPLAGASHDVSIFHHRSAGVDHLFVASAMFDRDGIYGDFNGTFGDNHLRYALLCRAALDTVRTLALPDRPPLGEQVLFHANDWQTALVPVYLEALYRPLGLYRQAATVLTLHNPAHQGRLPSRLFEDLELPPRWFGTWSLEFHGDLGLLKGGILHADQLTTVSPTFAWEITTPGGGFGLEPLLRHRAPDLTGILNGIDTGKWDPERDPFLPVPYSSQHMDGKATCKAELQRELGLSVDASAPLLGSVGRLDPQKGAELLLESVPWIVHEGGQVALLGSAAAAFARYEDQARDLARRFPGRVASYVGFDEGLSHRIEAGSDIFLMPSLFEPCGLNQMYSLRYGTPPVVRKTGGLADTVDPADQAGTSGTGFQFERTAGAAFRYAVWRAMDLWRRDPPAWRAMQLRGMARDFSWAAAVPAYQAVYREALRRRGLPG
jgi:starch synthase